MAPVRLKVSMEIRREGIGADGDYSLENEKSKKETYDSDNKNLGFQSVKCCVLALTFRRSKLGPSSKLKKSHTFKRSKLGPSSKLNESHPSRR